MTKHLLYIYGAIFLCFTWTLVRVEVRLWDENDTDINNMSKMLIRAYKLCYFTGWTFGLQIAFIAAAILDETSKLFDVPVSFQKRVSRFRASIFNTLVFPCSLIVMTVFWTIWHIDRELIFPREIDSFYPSWLNHTLHTFIGIPVLVELLQPKKYNFVRFGTAAKVLLLFLGIYQALYFSVYLRYGVWLYPVYAIMTWPQRLVFSIVQMTLALIFLQIGISIQNRKIPRISASIAKVK